MATLSTHQPIFRTLLLLSLFSSHATVAEAQTWIRQQQILGGSRTALFGDRIGVVANNTAYIFEPNSEGNWDEVSSFTTSDARNHTGSTFRIFGDTALLGDVLATVEGVDQAGAAYVFERGTTGEWIDVFKFIEPTPTAMNFFGENGFSLFEDTAILNGSYRDNNTFVIERTAQGDWVHSATLQPSDGLQPNGAYRGAALFGDTAVVGSLFAQSGNRHSSAAYVFERDDRGSWEQVAKLRPSDARLGDNFTSGTGGISLYGDTALIGASGLSAAYVFERGRDGGWVQAAKLTGSDAPHLFGTSVSLFGDMAFVSGRTAREADGLSNPQDVYVFQRHADDNWSQIGKITPPILGQRDSIAMRMFGDTAVINVTNQEPGVGVVGYSTFIYQLTGIAEGDYNRSGTVEQADLDLVLLNWGGDPIHPPLGWYSQLPVGPIDQSELDRVLLNWGNTSAGVAIAAAAAAVPEPNAVTLMIVGIGVAAGMDRRRRYRLRDSIIIAT